MCFHPVPGWLPVVIQADPGDTHRRESQKAWLAPGKTATAAACSEEGMEAEETDGHTPGLRGSLGRRHLPLHQEPGRKEVEEGRSLFPATSVSMASPAPCRPCLEEVGPSAGPRRTPRLLHPRGCSLSLEKAGGSVPPLSLASAGPLVLGIHVSFLFPFPFQY